MELKEEMVSQETVYQGIIVNVRRDKAKLPDGRLTNREVVEHPGGVAIFAMDDQDRVALVRQYRYPMGEIVLELPAGKLDPGEDPVTGALRELKEETGAEPGTLLPLGRMIPAPGCYGETLHLFLAKDLTFGPQHLDADEFLNVERVPFDELVHRCVNGEIDDGKTVAAVLRAKVLLNL